MPGPRPEINGQPEVYLRCLDLAGVVELDEAGIPVRFRRRCKNRRCCPPRDGWVAVHRWTITTGEYVTEYVPMRPASELLPVT